jgi:hypothetical protein
MTEQEILKKCPCLLGNPYHVRGGRTAQARELRWLRENLPADDSYYSASAGSGNSAQNGAVFPGGFLWPIIGNPAHATTPFPGLGGRLKSFLTTGKAPDFTHELPGANRALADGF